MANPQIIQQLAYLFLSWNQHTPKKLCFALLDAIQAQNWEQAQQLTPQLHDYMQAFDNPNPEGQFFWQEWQHLKAFIEAQDINKQLDLFRTE